MNPIQKLVRRPAVYIPLLISGFFVLFFFVLRPVFLRKAISTVNSKLRNHEYSSHWDGAEFKGINSVFVSSIYIQSKTGNREVQIDSVNIKVKLFPLIVKNVVLRRIDCRSLRLRYASGDSLRIPTPSPSDSSRLFEFLSNRNLSEIAYQVIRRFLNHIPSKVNFGMIEARYIYAGKASVISFKDLSFKKGEFNTDLLMTGEGSSVSLPVTGKFDRKQSLIEFHIVNPDTGLLPVPALRDRFDVGIGFDSLDYKVNFSERNRHRVNVIGELRFTDFEVNGKQLSTGNILIDRFMSSYELHIGPGFVEFDSSTVVVLNKLKFNPYLKLNMENGPVVDFRMMKQVWNADDFFSSLPPGMFTSLVGTKAQGYLDFFLDFNVDLRQPDSLRFDIRLKGKDFRVISFGLDDYRILNNPFVHRVYSKGMLVESFQVGPGNLDFTPFSSISSFLRAAVMTSEDGSFYYHNGFNPDAFRESIALNIKEGRFARGGSTISMQLVKNVFLTRNKTVARKIEEALIVWLIENLNLVSKQRMYEVYLNIIEWGPGIYGIAQASEFYFNKRPAELSLEESIFLASIVPRPKWFKYTFESNGRPRSFFAAYFNRMKELMVRKEFIVASDTLGVMPLVTLTGPASLALDTAGQNTMPEFQPLEPILIKKFTIK